MVQTCRRLSASPLGLARKEQGNDLTTHGLGCLSFVMFQGAPTSDAGPQAHTASIIQPVDQRLARTIKIALLPLIIFACAAHRCNGPRPLLHATYAFAYLLSFRIAERTRRAEPHASPVSVVSSLCLHFIFPSHRQPSADRAGTYLSVPVSLFTDRVPHYSLV